MNATVISTHHATRIVAAASGIKIGSSLDHFIDQVIAEYLRQTLYLLSQGGRAVYVTQLMNTVQRHLAPLWPELYEFRERRSSLIEQQAEGDLHPDRVRRVLEVLSDLRDCVDLGEGYWLPAPLRFVFLPASERVLVVGGLATSELRRMLGSEVSLVGFARIVSEVALPDDIRRDPSRWQAYEAWCGDAPLDLREWTKSYMTQASRQLRHSASGFVEFEVYAPWLRRRQPQYFRWIGFTDFVSEVKNPPRTLLLCRSIPQRMRGPRTYWLGVVDSHGLKREVPVPSTHVRRLSYGLDLCYGAPTRVFWQGDRVLVIRNRLPPEEQRILIAIGRDVSETPGRLPLHLEIGPEWRDFINDRLSRLGIEIVSG